MLDVFQGGSIGLLPEVSKLTAINPRLGNFII
jgi:hypothetical protein